MRGEIPLKTSFLRRVKILSNISVHEVNDIVANIPLNEAIAEFIRENRDRCYVLTGNIDVWISGLMENLGMENHTYCSKAEVVNDRIPLPAFNIRTREIDTPDDYNRAIEWFENGMVG